MIDLIKKIVEAIVDDPDQVEVKAVEGEHTLIIEVCVAKEDLGKVIGKQGRTARAIRTILAGASGKAKKRASFEIIE
jgi:predicted RNA-binding protein YlqC (UPF0109 family)